MQQHKKDLTPGELESVMWQAFHEGQVPLALRIAKQIPTRGRAKTLQAVMAWREGDNQLALALLEKALTVAPADQEILSFYARTHMEIGDKDKALEAYFRLLELGKRPNQAIDLALALLFCGHFPQGWALYDSRVQLEWPKLGLMGCPQWAGEPGPVQVVHDGGFGDSIQFSRLLKYPLLGGRELFIRVPRHLVRLFQHNYPWARVGETIQDGVPSILMMSLPRAVGMETGDIDGRPYMTVPQGRQQVPAGPDIKVGICWGGSPLAPRDVLRSLTALHLQQLTGDLPGIEWVVLQQGPHSEKWPQGLGFRPEITDFQDTAEVMGECDLILTVDTSVAHLAGALGCPTWVMVPTVPDFRWAPGQRWYNSVEVIRQPRPGDWPAVIADVRSRLKELVSCQQTVGGPVCH